MAERKSTKPEWQKKIALERITRLFGQAEKEFMDHPERSHRYVQLARKIAMRYNIGIPKEYKRRFCKKCYSYLVPGANCKVRTNARQRAVTVTCGECGNIMRFPYRKEKKSKKK